MHIITVAPPAAAHLPPWSRSKAESVVLFLDGAVLRGHAAFCLLVLFFLSLPSKLIMLTTELWNKNMKDLTVCTVRTLQICLANEASMTFRYTLLVFLKCVFETGNRPAAAPSLWVFINKLLPKQENGNFSCLKRHIKPPKSEDRFVTKVKRSHRVDQVRSLGEPGDTCRAENEENHKRTEWI